MTGDRLDLACRAVDLVLRDVVAVLGDDVVRAVYPGSDELGYVDALASSEPEFLDRLTHPGLGVSDVDVWVFVNEEAHGSTGLSGIEGVPLPVAVVKVAEAIQLEVIESRSSFGTAFPALPGTPEPSDVA